MATDGSTAEQAVTGDEQSALQPTSVESPPEAGSNVEPTDVAETLNANETKALASQSEQSVTGEDSNPSPSNVQVEPETKATTSEEPAKTDSLDTSRADTSQPILETSSSTTVKNLVSRDDSNMPPSIAEQLASGGDSNMSPSTPPKAATNVDSKDVANAAGLTDGLSINIEEALPSGKPAVTRSTPLFGPATSSPRTVSKHNESSAVGSPRKHVLRSPRSSPGMMSPKEVPRTPVAGEAVSISAARALLPFLVDWLNFYAKDVSDRVLTMSSLAEGLKSGIVLCQLIERLVPDLESSEKPYSGKGLYQRPIARKTCITNLERALSIAWRRGVPATNMCTADEIVDGKVSKIARCLVALFQSLQMREICARGRDTMQGMHVVLGRWGWHLSARTLNDPIGFGSSLITDFADGIRIMILLVYYGLATSHDLLRINARPEAAERHENFVVVNSLLIAAGCPLFLSSTDWVTPPGLCFDVLLFQLDLIWRGISVNWFGLLNRQPATDMESLETLVFKDGPAVAPIVETPANVDSPISVRVADESDRKTFQAPTPLSPGRSPRSPVLWRKGDNASDLALLHEFRLDLLTHFEDLVAAFDAFDSRKFGFITLSEFQWGCRAVAFEGSAKRLFVILDLKDNGRISRAAFLAMETLPESSPQRLLSPKQSPLRPEADGVHNARDQAMLKQFAEAVLQTYGSFEEGFRISDRRSKGSLSHFDLDRLCKVIGLRCDPKFLFSRLDVRKVGHVSRHDLLSLKSLVDVVPIMTIPPQPILWEEGNDLSDLSLLRDFASSLYDCFRDLEEAFNSFDVSCVGTLSMSDIRRGVRASGFQGDANKLFVLLDADREGFITREAFYSLDRLPDMSANSGPAWRFDEEGQIRMIFDFPYGDHEWPSPSVDERNDGDGEARFPGSAEELAWLMDEDQRRKLELADMELHEVVERHRKADVAAMAAAEEEIDDYSLPMMDFPATISKIQGTTSIDAHIELRDTSLQRIWIQTAVVDRTGTGSNAADDAALVIEIREFQPDGKLSGDMRVQLDVSKISAVNQMGPAAFEEAEHDLSFVVVAHPRALLKCGPEANVFSELGTKKTIQREPDELFHLSENGKSLLLHIVVGPSKWKRHEGICFFDELRILMHFVADGVVSAATSIGKAAGAAVLAVSNGK